MTADGLRSEGSRAGSPPFPGMKSKPTSKCILLFGMLVYLSGTGAVGQGIYAVTRRTRIHPALGSFQPNGAAAVVSPAPLLTSFPQSAGNTFAGRANAQVPAQSAESQAEAARKTLEFQIQRSKAGSAYAQYDMGLRHLTGDGVLMDRAEALRLLEQSAKQGNTQAARKLVELRGMN